MIVDVCTELHNQVERLEGEKMTDYTTVRANKVMHLSEDDRKLLDPDALT